MVGVENKDDVEDLLNDGGWDNFKEHIVEICREGEVIIRLYGCITVSQPVAGGNDGRKLGDKPYRRPVANLLVEGIPGGVVHAHRGSHRLEKVHGVAVFRKVLHHPEYLQLEPRMAGNIDSELLHLFGGRQLSVEEQV